MNKDNKIFGKHPVKMALQNPKRKHHTLFLTKNSLPEFEDILNQLTCEVKIVDNQFISAKFEESVNHQGAFLISSLKQIPNIDDLIRQNPEKCRVLILDQITDIHNIGAILRSAIAFNVKNVIMTSNHAPHDYGTIAKSSSGHSELVDIIQVGNLAAAIKQLKNNGFWCIGLDGDAKITLNQVNPSLFDEKSAIILGSEGKGMRRLTKELCDEIAKIHMNTEVESLNVSNACAIALYEFYGKNL